MACTAKRAGTWRRRPSNSTVVLLLALALAACPRGGGARLAPSSPAQRALSHLPSGVFQLRGGFGSPPRDDFARSNFLPGVSSDEEERGGWVPGSSFDSSEEAPQDAHAPEVEDDRDGPAPQRSSLLSREYNVRGEMEWMHPPQAVTPLGKAVKTGPSAQSTDRDMLAGSGGEGAVLVQRVGMDLTSYLPPPPPLLPFLPSLQLKRAEGPPLEPFPTSCVPTGPIQSEEKEMIQIWRQGNEFLIPHFARMEQRKQLNGTLAQRLNASSPLQTTRKAVPDQAAPSPHASRHTPILTDQHDPDDLIHQLELLNVSASLPLSRGSGPEVLRMGTAMKMLRFRSLQLKAKPNAAIAGEDVDATHIPLAVSEQSVGFDALRRRPWLKGANMSAFAAEEDAFGEERCEEQLKRRSTTVIAIMGTGRMGSRLATLWAMGGFRVVLGSREASRGQVVAAELSRALPQGASPIQGGSLVWAARQGHVVVLATPFSATAGILAEIRGAVCGAGKVILDVTNAKYDHRDVENTAGVDIHRAVLGDSSSAWAVGYKSVFAFKLSFGADNAQEILICGDREARITVADMVKSHHWNPRICGDLSNAKELELGRRVAHIRQMYGES